MAAKRKQRKPLKSIGKLKEEAATLLQKLRRMESADNNGMCQCVSCIKVLHWKEMQGGHFIPRGKSPTLLEETNIHPQCPPCNGFGMKYGDSEKNYTLYMLDMYGRDHVNWLLSIKDMPWKWSRVDLEAKIAEYKARIRELE